MRRYCHLAVVVLALSAGLAFSKKSMEVNCVEHVRTTFSSVGVLPATCPAAVDCLRFERDIAATLKTYKGLKVVSAKQIRQFMFEEELEPSDGTALRVAEHFELDALLIAAWGHYSEDVIGSFGVAAPFFAGAVSSTMVETETRGSLKVWIQHGRTRKLLMRAVVQGKAADTEENYLLRRFVEDMIWEAFGRRGTKWKKPYKH